MKIKACLLMVAAISTLVAVPVSAQAIAVADGGFAISDSFSYKPLQFWQSFIVRYPYTNVKEKGVRTQTPGKTIRELRDYQAYVQEQLRLEDQSTLVSAL